MRATLGPFAIDRELGTGGMGTVYAATVTEPSLGLALGSTVALKVVHPHLIETPGFLPRFLREAELGASVRHPNVVRTLGCEQQPQTGLADCYLVMEYVEGQTLAALGGELERVPEELCRHVAREICRGLAAIHAAGIVHRDIKPDNVLITREHDVKLMDLGVALLMDESIRLSQSGAFVGSVEYAAPEQFDGSDVDGRTDLFALGILLYEIASGVHPHRGGGFSAVLRRVLNATPRPLGEVNPQLSAFFEEVVHTLLVKDPRGRFASAAQLLAVLEEGEDSTWWHERARARQAQTQRPIRRIRIPRETSVYGRERELELLRELYAKADAGEGRVLLIEGEAGIGKSRLVDELIGRLQAGGADLNFLFGSYPPGGAASASGAFSTAFREQFGEEGAAPYLGQTPLLVPAFEALLRGDVAPDGSQTLTSDSIATCFIEAARALGAQRPTVILIDDLHFAPEEARSLFSALAMALPGHRVLLIGTTRSSADGDWRGNLQRFDHVSTLLVERLFPKDLAELLTDCFKSEQLATSLGHQIAVKSDGNPFFAFEIIRGLREGQFITQEADGTWIGTQVIEDIQIPSSVLDLVNARVADLSEDERDLLDVACCWGFEFDPGLIGDALGIGRIPLLKRFAQIERAHRLVRASGRSYVFDHHQVQEALYGSLHEQLREEYHAALADTVEARCGAAEKEPDALDGTICVDLAEHFLSGARGERARRYIPAALTHLENGYLHAHVAALAERSLNAPGLLEGHERVTMLVRVAGPGGSLDRMGSRVRQEEYAREASRLATDLGDDELRMRALLAVGSALRVTSRYAEAEPPLRDALVIAERIGDHKTADELLRALGIVLWSQGRREHAQEHWERALTRSRESGHRRGEAAVIGNIGMVLHAEGRLTEARAHHERHLALCRETGNRVGEAGAMVNLGNVLLAEGRPAEAQEHYERGIAVYDEIGDRSHAATTVGNLGNAFMVQGDLGRARAHYERHLALSREIGDPKGESRATGNLGSVLWSLGRLDEAKELFARYQVLSREIGYRGGEAVSHHNLGAVFREENETERAREHLRDCLVICEETGDRYLASATHLALGSAGATAEATTDRASLEIARDLAAENGYPGVETLARCELACLPDGDVAGALATHAANEERLDSSERREARYLLWKATGDRTHLAEARRLLDQAVANVDDEACAAMLENIRVHREIVAACESRTTTDDDRSASAGESPTRVG